MRGERDRDGDPERRGEGLGDSRGEGEDGPPVRPPACTSVQAQARLRPAPRRPGRVWARSAGSSSRISTPVSTCGRGDRGRRRRAWPGSRGGLSRH